MAKTKTAPKLRAEIADALARVQMEAKSPQSLILKAIRQALAGGKDTQFSFEQRGNAVTLRTSEIDYTFQDL